MKYITAALSCCKKPSQLSRLFKQKNGYWLITQINLFGDPLSYLTYDLQLKTISFQPAVPTKIHFKNKRLSASRKCSRC